MDPNSYDALVRRRDAGNADVARMVGGTTALGLQYACLSATPPGASVHDRARIDGWSDRADPAAALRDFLRTSRTRRGRYDFRHREFGRGQWRSGVFSQSQLTARFFLSIINRVDN